MINPSSTGWIDKFFVEQKNVAPNLVLEEADFYKKLRATGIVFGHIVGFETTVAIDLSKWTQEEISKVGLLHCLFLVFCRSKDSSKSKMFVEKAAAFYREMNPKRFGFLKRVLPENFFSRDLEKMIDDRVQTNKNIVSKNFSPILTNALLFVDVLAFEKFLKNGFIPPNYTKRLEETILSVILLGLQTKKSNSNYADLLVKLFETSVRYTKFSNITVQDLEVLELDHFETKMEKWYLIDLAGLSIWSEDWTVDDAIYLYQMANLMGISIDDVEESLAEINAFITTNKKAIPYFNYANPMKNFYDHASQKVVLLISRNKIRLTKELEKNGELVLLLTHSTHRHLEDMEKKKIKKQLLEICKTIPSLTIFMLPGGSLLLPLFIKLLPKMLPESFNENSTTD